MQLTLFGEIIHVVRVDDTQEWKSLAYNNDQMVVKLRGVYPNKYEGRYTELWRRV